MLFQDVISKLNTPIQRVTTDQTPVIKNNPPIYHNFHYDCFGGLKKWDGPSPKS